MSGHAKFPQVTVRLTGENGNTLNLLAVCSRAMRRAGISQADVDQLTRDVLGSASYEDALRAMMATVSVR